MGGRPCALRKVERPIVPGFHSLSLAVFGLEPDSVVITCELPRDRSVFRFQPIRAHGYAVKRGDEFRLHVSVAVKGQSLRRVRPINVSDFSGAAAAGKKESCQKNQDRCP